MSARDPYDMFRRQAHGPGRTQRQGRVDPRGLSPEALDQIRREYARMEQEVLTLRQEREQLLRERETIAERFEQFREENGRRERLLQHVQAEVEAERSARHQVEAELARLREALASTGAPSAPSPTEDAAALEAELRAVSVRYTELQDDLQRVRDRQQAELARAYASGAEAALSELLDMSDNLDRAIGAAPERDGPWFTGLVALRQQLVAALQRQGLQRFGQPGERFDPRLHEATGTRPATEALPDGHVVAVDRAGYRRADGTVLRPAYVVVAQA